MLKHIENPGQAVYIQQRCIQNPIIPTSTREFFSKIISSFQSLTKKTKSMATLRQAT